MILCITPNPNIERTWTVPKMHLGKEHRVREVVSQPSGKGVNVARAIQILDKRVICAGFLGGHTGRWIAEAVEKSNIPSHWTWIDGESRLAVAIADPEKSGKEVTLISEPGPQVTTQDWTNLRSDILSIIDQATLICISGSLPQGSSGENLRDLILAAKRRGKSVWVDASGFALKSALESQPTGVKFNQREALDVSKIPINDIETARNFACRLVKGGVGAVCLTLGSTGAFFCNDQGSWIAQPPRLQIKSYVGSGDAFMGGLLAGIVEGKSIPEGLRMATAAGAANTLTLGGGTFSHTDYLHILPLVTVRQL